MQQKGLQMTSSKTWLTAGLMIAALGTAPLAVATNAWAFGSGSSSSSTSASNSATPSSSATYDAALAKIKAGDYGSAIPLLQQSLASDPNNPDALNELGFSYRKLGHYSDSLDAYKKALALQPNHVDANEYLGELYLQMKRPDLAKQQLEILGKLCPSGCEQRGDLEKQIQSYQG